MDLATFTDAQITDLQAALMAEVERRRAETFTAVRIG